MLRRTSVEYFNSGLIHDGISLHLEEFVEVNRYEFEFFHTAVATWEGMGEW